MTARDPRFAELDSAIAREMRAERGRRLGRRQSEGRRVVRVVTRLLAARPSFASRVFTPAARDAEQRERRRAYLVETGKLEQLRAEGLC